MSGTDECLQSEKEEKTLVVQEDIKNEVTSVHDIKGVYKF